MNNDKFAKMILDENVKVFIVYINSLRAKIIISLTKKAQIFLLFV